MHADLVKLGFDWSCERVAACVRDWKGDRLRARQTADRGTDLPLVFRPGEMEWLPPSPDGIGMCQGCGIQRHAKRRTAKGRT